jgi:arylformamidase
MSWIDISVPLKSGMVHWPGDPPVKIRRVRDMDSGDTANLSLLSMGAHSGTHMDAPLHFLRGGKGLDEMPLSATVGSARVIEIEDRESVKVDELRRHRIRRGERVLFKTINSHRCWKTDSFVEDFVYLSTEAGRFLADRRVRAVGIDYLSVGGFEKNGIEVHRALLKAEVWIIEGLDLSRLRPGNYELVCLPLRIIRSDGAPARAIVRRLPP